MRLKSILQSLIHVLDARDLLASRTIRLSFRRAAGRGLFPEAPARPRRRSRTRLASNGDAEAVEAPEPLEAPEAESAPEPDDAPEAQAPARPGGNGAAPSGARRQPRPKGTAKGSRPAGGSRSKKKR